MTNENNVSNKRGFSTTDKLMAHVGSEVKGIIMARTKSAVTRLRLCAHSKMALY